MPKVSSTKTATKKAAADKPEKEKRAPTAYNIFMKDQLPIYKSENPGVGHSEAFKAVAKMWAESDANPNKGQPIKARAPKKSKKSEDEDDGEEQEEEKENKPKKSTKKSSETAATKKTAAKDAPAKKSAAKSKAKKPVSEEPSSEKDNDDADMEDD